MKKLLFCICLILFSTSLIFSQENFNVDLVSVVEYSQNCNDVWGYVAEDGTEYAIFGTTTGTAIIDLRDPANPVEVLFIPGANSVWRDMKNWGHFVYVTTDQGQDGLTVIDMSGAPNNITWELWKPEITINGESRILERCHNLYIDENGVCYLSGCNMNSGGVMLIDVFTTPGKPEFMVACDARYSHDSYARGDTLYSSDINAGSFSVIDVSDKTKPVTLVQQETSFRFTHNSWLSDDGKYLFTTDERANAFIDAFDISDLSNIRKVDRIRPIETEGKGVIPHNVHVKDGFLVISWYTDGIVIVDANRPSNMVKVGSYDTWLGAHGGFNGAWGAYPWLPSGLILGGDINTGLFVLQPQYVRAAYLEGNVTDSENGMALNGVQVSILSDQPNLKNSDASGNYKTGIAYSGTFTIQFSKPGYRTLWVEAELINGEVTILDVELEPARSFTFAGQVVDNDSGEPVPNPIISITNEHQDIEIQGNEDGTFEVTAYEGITTILAGAWGYKYYYAELFSVESQDFTIFLDKGYEDDFVFDYGWTVTGDALVGRWERAVPQGAPSINPPTDVLTDFGNEAYVTGPLAGNNSGAFDVDEGTTILTSPLFDLSDYTLPELSYYRWYHNSGGNTPINDTLKVYLSNGSEEILLEEVWGVTNQNGWVLSPSFDLASLIDLTDEMQIRFEASDLLPDGHIVEAGVDVFRVVETMGGTSTEEELALKIIEIAPNPNNGRFLIQHPKGVAMNGQIQLANISGQLVWSQNVHQAISTEVNVKLQPGIYFVHLIQENQLPYVGKVMVH